MTTTSNGVSHQDLFSEQQRDSPTFAGAPRRLVMTTTSSGVSHQDLFSEQQRDLPTSAVALRGG